MDLAECRAEIDEIDRELVSLFLRRMEAAERIAAYKRANGLPILQPAREAQKLAEVCAQAPEALRPYLRALYERLFALSRAYQERV